MSGSKRRYTQFLAKSGKSSTGGGPRMDSQDFEHTKPMHIKSPKFHEVTGPRLERAPKHGYICTTCQKGVRRKMLNR